MVPRYSSTVPFGSSRQHGMAPQGRKQFLIVRPNDAGQKLALDSGRCVQILRDADHLDTRGFICCVDLGKILDGLSAAELEQHLRQYGVGPRPARPGTVTDIDPLIVARSTSLEGRSGPNAPTLSLHLRGGIAGRGIIRRQRSVKFIASTLKLLRQNQSGDLRARGQQVSRIGVPIVPTSGNFFHHVLRHGPASALRQYREVFVIFQPFPDLLQSD
jgi:hypothetical protein